MSNITLQSEGRRVYVAGNSFPIKEQIKAAGGHWDGERKQWWIGVNKKEEIEKAIAGAKPAASNFHEETGENMRVIGKAIYKGKAYFVVWAGRTKKGTPEERDAMKLAFRDGSKTFWANMGSGAEDARWEKRYQEPKTIKSINDYAAKMKSEGGRENRGFGKRTGCSCGSVEYADGSLSDNACRQCQFDAYDN